MEELWAEFIDIIIKAASESYGTKRNKKMKQTPSWSKEIKAEVKKNKAT